MTERLSDERVRTYVTWGTDPDDDMDRHVASLAREVQASRKLRADLLALHHPEPDPDQDNAPFCDACDHPAPCPTVRLLESDDE